MTRLLVTGGSGFIGSGVLQQLAARGIETIALGRRKPAIGTVAFCAADLLTEDVTPQLRALKPTHLLHLAWEARPGYYRTAPENADWQAASLRLAKAFAAAGGEHIVFAGSCAEYRAAPADSLGNFDEYAAPPADDCAYAIAKRETEEELAALAAAQHMRFASGRVFYIYGPGEPAAKLVSSICRGLAAGTPVPLSAGTDVVDYIYKDDVSRALVELALSGVAGPVNIGSGRGVAVREIAETLGRLSGRADLLQFGQIPMNRPPVRIVAATRRLSDTLGFTPATALEDGLAACYNDWRNSTTDP